MPNSTRHQGDEDSGLMSNIATTAKDLFGALWTYGGQPSTSDADPKRESTKDAE